MIQMMPLTLLIMSLQVADPIAIHTSGLPSQLPLPGVPAVRQFTTGIEEPMLYDVLASVMNLSMPTTRPESDKQASTAAPLDRPRLLASPQAQVGKLLATEGRFIESLPLKLVGSPAGEPKRIWSTLLVQRQGDQPVQILSLTNPPEVPRLANVRAIGYFYKIRQDQARKPGPKGVRAAVEVPVLIGWVWPEPDRQGSVAGTFAKYVLPTVLGIVFLGFLLMAMASRRRSDWRTRVAQSRSRRRYRGSPDPLDADSIAQQTDDVRPHDDQ